MTWPVASPQPGTPAEVPTAPPTALQLGDLFPATFKTYGRRFGLFVGLMLAPVAVSLVLLLVWAALFAGVMYSQFGSRPVNDPSTVFGALGVAGLTFIPLLLVTSALSYLYVGRSSVAALDLATGRIRPTWKNLAERTPGLLKRLIVLVLIVIGLVLVAYLLFGLLMVLVMMPAIMGSGSRDGGAAAGASALLMFVLILAVMVVGIFISVKLLYTVPIMAEEGLGAIEAMKRSWSMVKGAFWKTLGYSLVLGIIVYFLSMLASTPLYMMGATLGASTSSSSSSNPPVGQLVAMFVAMAITMLLSAVIYPLQYIWTALMYLGRTRELAGIAPAAYGYGSTVDAGQGYSAPADAPYGTSTAWDTAPQRPTDPRQQPWHGDPSSSARENGAPDEQGPRGSHDGDYFRRPEDPNSGTQS